MPVIKGQKKYTRIWRPSGTRYASAKAMLVNRAIQEARRRFRVEFGAEPIQERTIIEIVGVTAAWDVDVFELPVE